jgi:hypothetical protein
MWLRREGLYVLAALLLLTSGCAGYRLGSDAPSVLPPDRRTLAISSVKNPTLRFRLEYRLRSLLRDELTNRNMAKWTEPDKAASLMSLVIHRFIVTSAVTDEEDKTTKYRVEFRLTAQIRDRESHAIFWESGEVVASESFQTADRGTAEQQALELAVRELADRMGFAY